MVRGAHIRYFVGGDGSSLVLVHGLGGAASNWVELAPALSRSYRVLALDLPGHGGSSPLPAAPSLTPFADVVAAVAEREGLLPAAVVGHSFGGLVTLRLALRRPEAVRALLLASATGTMRSRAPARTRQGQRTRSRSMRGSSATSARPALRTSVCKAGPARNPSTAAADSAAGSETSKKPNTG